MDATCGQLPRNPCLQGGGSYKVQAVLKRSEFFTIAWQTLPQPVGFTVQPDGRSCEVEEELPLDGSRRLLQTGG